MLKDFARRRRQETGSLEVEAEDQMDDGTPIRLKVQIDEQQVGNHFYFCRFESVSELELHKTVFAF